MSTSLPPGQFALKEFPRFGLGLFARRFPANPERVNLEIGGDVEQGLRISSDELRDLPRVEREADFHCVTTWSVQGQVWSGVRFADFYERIVVPQVRPQPGAELVVLRGEDGYASSLPLADLLAADALLADQLNGAGLGIEHGAPLRLVAPAHYGYKNVKHLAKIEFWRDRRAYRFPFPYPAFMDHPRGRVAFEERGRWIPAAILRWLYRLLIPSTIRSFRKATERYRGLGP